MGQSKTQMSLFHCNWSYLGKHQSIFSIIAMSMAPRRLLHTLLLFIFVMLIIFSRPILKMYFSRIMHIVNGHFFVTHGVTAWWHVCNSSLSWSIGQKKWITSVHCWHPNFCKSNLLNESLSVAIYPWEAFLKSFYHRGSFSGDEMHKDSSRWMSPAAFKQCNHLIMWQISNIQ